MLSAILITLTIFSIALFGSCCAMSGMKWYRALHLPWWMPSGWLFSFLWSTIYVTTNASAIIAWTTLPHDLRFLGIFGMFVGNALLNVFWTDIFFVRHRLGLAFLDAACVCCTALLLMVLLWPSSPLAALLLLPYSMWTTFATYLAFTIWKMNRKRSTRRA